MKDWDIVLILRRVGHFYGDWCYRYEPHIAPYIVLSEVRYAQEAAKTMPVSTAMAKAQIMASTD